MFRSRYDRYSLFHCVPSHQNSSRLASSLSYHDWGFLLQREVDRSITDGCQPNWAVDSAVFHLNGTVEQLSDPTHRSPFLLEEDPSTARQWTAEANIAYEKMMWERTFVVVGMSFECETDRFLLHALHRVENDMPIGESTWIIVNPNQTALDLSAERIKRPLPGCGQRRNFLN